MATISIVDSTIPSLIEYKQC